ncbi:MAG: hypothetical protein ACK4YP_07290 [Myxococcota bacterium]
MRRLASLLPLLVACQDYNLNGSGDAAGKYNPPDLGAKEQVDRVTQVTVPAVDVLWVVDNSCSMEEEQRALRDNFPNFMDYFLGSGLDYHIGVVTTDMFNARESGRLIHDGNGTGAYIDPSFDEEDALSSFRYRSDLGTNGSSDEKGKDAAFAALDTHRYDANDGFYREDASLSVIVISDEVDYSEMSVVEFSNWMLGLKTDPRATVSFSSIVGPEPSGCPTAERGRGYLEATRNIGGIEWSICEEDWGPLLTELGLSAAGLKREFFLSLVPVESTLSVTVEDDGEVTPYAADVDWTYSRSRNSITFVDYTPTPLSIVEIRYEVLASSSGIDEGEDTAPPEDTGVGE